MQGAGYLVPNNREERLSRNRQVSSPLNNQIQQSKNTYTGQATKRNQHYMTRVTEV